VGVDMAQWGKDVTNSLRCPLDIITALAPALHVSNPHPNY
jgi:hypothetical protein